MAIDWDTLYELTPSDTTYVKDTDDVIRSTKTAVRERITKEHEFDLASQARQGLHRAGSAVAFYQASEPTTRNGVALAAADAGLLYVDSDDKLAKVWDGDSFEGLVASNSLLLTGVAITTTGNGLKAIHGHYRSTSPTGDAVFDALSPAIPNTSDEMSLSGAVMYSGDLLIVGYAIRDSASQITIYGAQQDIDTGARVLSTLVVTNGGGAISNAPTVILSW